MSEMGPRHESAESPHGSAVPPRSQPATLPLEQFAAVQAGLLDGFALTEILKMEGLDEERWHEGRAEHLEQIATEPDAFLQYQGALEAHQDRLRCPVSPLYDDVAAWVAFVQRADATPMGTLCSELGITPGDMARLQRHWKGRLQGDPAVAKQARKLREGTPRPQLPAVKVGERTYVPWAGAAPAPNQDPEGATSAVPSGGNASPEEDLDRMAALQAYLTEGVDFALLQSRYDLASRDHAERLLAGFRAALAADKQQVSYFRARVEHFRRLAAARLTPVVTHQHPHPSAREPVDRPPVLHVAHAEPPPSLLDATGALDPALLGLAPLPFLEGAPVVPPPSATWESASSDDVGSTAMVDLVKIEETALPFARVRSQPLRDLAEISVDETATLDLELVAQLVALPTTPFHGSVEALPGKDAWHESERPPSTTLGETGLLDMALLSQAESPFRAPRPSAERQPPSVIDASPLSEDVRAYASYCVELAEYSDDVERVRSRYGVTSLTQHEDITALWSTRLASDPLLRTRFRQACETYKSWLQSRKPGGGS